MKPLAREITAFAKSLPVQYDLLDVGCGSKPYKALFTGAQTYTGLDIVEGPNVDIVGKAWELPLPDNSVDVIISTQVLEHTEQFEKTVSEMQRVLKPGGRIFISAPFAFQEHGMPYDYWRFTQSGLRSVFANFTIEQVKPLQGTIGTLYRLWNSFLVNTGPQPLTHYIFAPVYVLTNLAGIICDAICNVLFSWQDAVIHTLLKRETHFHRNYWALTENYALVARNDSPVEVTRGEVAQ